MCDIINKTLGFIILRHVNNSNTNQYWIHCYNCIRQFYPKNKILIIDDNSNYEYITNISLYKTTIIQSEYPQRGELLPYYYYLHNKLFDSAVIIHDSVFINKYIDFNVDKYKMIWDFEHYWDLIENETYMIKLFNDIELLNFYENKKLWNGCFGGMSIITFDYLNVINNNYNINKLLDCILTRQNRCAFERVIACLLQKENQNNDNDNDNDNNNNNNNNNNDNNNNNKTLLGNIHKYIKWGITFDDINKFKHLPLIKVWTGR